uniref:Uncharacterized protein n=1 Tax=Anguilla anguilla TaxID=7936 RepID=A0A0E9TW67_ANGAN
MVFLSSTASSSGDCIKNIPLYFYHVTHLTNWLIFSLSPWF